VAPPPSTGEVGRGHVEKPTQRHLLVTLAGEQALPLLEPFTQDKNEWVRHYACRAKEYIQQGKVFVLAPYF
jgi:hypothetical protein